MYSIYNMLQHAVKLNVYILWVYVVHYIPPSFSFSLKLILFWEENCILFYIISVSIHKIIIFHFFIIIIYLFFSYFHVPWWEEQNVYSWKMWAIGGHTCIILLTSFSNFHYWKYQFWETLQMSTWVIGTLSLPLCVAVFLFPFENHDPPTQYCSFPRDILLNWNQILSKYLFRGLIFPMIPALALAWKSPKTITNIPIFTYQIILCMWT